MSAQTETPQAAMQQQEAAPVQLVLNIQLPNPADPNQALSMEELQKQIALQVAALTANPRVAAPVAPAQAQPQAVGATEQTVIVTQAVASAARETTASTAATPAAVPSAGVEVSTAQVSGSLQAVVTPAASSGSSTAEVQAAAIPVQTGISTTPAVSQTTSSAAVQMPPAVQTETAPAATPTPAPAADASTEQPTATIAVQTTADQHATVNTEETTATATVTTTVETSTASSTETATVSADATESSTTSDLTSEAVVTDETEEEEEEATFVPEKKARPPGDGPRKRALIIGISYVGTSAELDGCIEDAQNIQELLKSVYGYVDDNIFMLTDDQTDPGKVPTRDNILYGIRWLLDEAKANDTFFFHYSGHGSNEEDSDGDEVDGRDEVICPSDYDSEGYIKDDILNKFIVQGVPHGARLVAVFDSCNSGSVMDLPYMYSMDCKVKSESLLSTATKGLLSAGLSYMNGETTDMYDKLSSLGSRLITTRHKEHMNKFKKSSKADVVMLSGCRDDEYSHGAFEENKHSGALTYAFIKSLKENPNPTYRQLLTSVREKLHVRYQQTPEFSSSHEVDFDTIFAA